MTAWDTEFAPPRLVAIADAVRGLYRLDWASIGMKGDRSHTYGYHRSKRWIDTLGSGSSDYSNQLALDRSGGNSDWVSALDVSLDSARLKVASARMLAAMQRRDPAIADVREFYGTVDGRTVTGWDAVRNGPATSDASHLSHLHASFYRSRADADHSGLLRVLSTDGGTGMADDYGPYGKPAVVNDRTIAVMIADIWGQEIGEDSPFASGSNPSVRSERARRTEAAVAAVASKVDSNSRDIRADIARLSTGGVDPAALAAAVAELILPTLSAAIRTVVAEELSTLTLKAQ